MSSNPAHVSHFLCSKLEILIAQISLKNVYTYSFLKKIYMKSVIHKILIPIDNDAAPLKGSG